MAACAVFPAPLSAQTPRCGSHAQIDAPNRGCVILYDARVRLAYLVPRSAIADAPKLNNMLKAAALGALPADWTRDADGFLLDNRPVEFFVFNRKLKETYSVNVLTVFTLQGGAADIRGIAPVVAQPPAAPPTTPAATPPASHGAAPLGTLTVDTVFTNLLNEKNFDQARQYLLSDADSIRTSARELDAQFQAYADRLQHLIGTVPAAVPNVQGSATLLRTTAAFERATYDFGATFADPADLELEYKFDLANLRISSLLGDVQSINTAVQSFPIVDSLYGQPQSLQNQMEGFESQITGYRNDLQTVRTAERLLRSLNADYVTCLNEAEIRKDIRSHYSAVNTPTLDDATVAEIAKKYSDACNNGAPARLNPYVPAILRDKLERLDHELDDYEAGRVPDSELLRPRRVRGEYDEAVKLLRKFRADIDNLNEAEANTLEAINLIYRNYRVLQPTRVDLNLGGAGGNLSVNYAVTGVEQFPPYTMQNRVPQPVTTQQAPPPAAPTTPAAPPATPAATASVSPAGAQTTATPGAATPPAAPTTNPPAEYTGNFQVHHFTAGTALAGFAFSSIANRSYSLVSCPYCPSFASPVDLIAESDEKPGRAVVVGIDVYFKQQDMYPGVRRTWQNRFLPSGVVFGASVDPLNQYFLGLAAEPIRGFTYSFGGTVGQQNRLPLGQYPGQPVGYTGSGGTTPTYTAPTLGSASGFRAGAFAMVAFDLNLFQTVFSKAFGGATSLGPPGAGTTTTTTGGK